MHISHSFARAWLFAIVPALLLAAVVLAAPITGTFTGLGPYATVTGTFNGASVSYSGGTMKLTIDGTTVGSFCTDLEHPIRSGDTLVSTEAQMDCRITWLLLNYPPLLSTDPYTPTGSMLSNRSQEMATRQAAVWHFSDGFLPSTGNTVGDRAWQIINSVPADACATLQAEVPVLTVQPSASVRTVGDNVETFTVTAMRGGAPISGLTLHGSTNFGTLSNLTATTGANGQALFTLTNTGGITGTANFIVSATVDLPVGTIFEGSPSAEKQKLVLGKMTPGSIYGSGNVTWQAPGSIVAHIFHDRNLDGVQNGAEDNLQSWSVALYQWSGSAWTLLSTKTTNASGLALFTGLAAGQYRADETVQSSWRATTASSVQVMVGVEAHNVEFGVIRTPTIVATKFNDADADGMKDADEPALAGWTMTLYRADGSAVLGATGATDAEGKVVLTFDRASDFDPGAYFVQETQQPLWFATTGGISQNLTLAGNDFITVTFGNALARPALNITKSAPFYAHVGDAITFNYTVLNTGNVALSDVSVSDPLAGGAITMCNRGALAVGASYACSATYTVGAGDPDPLGSTARASGTDAFGQSATDTDSASTDILHPTIDLSATGPSLAHDSDMLDYSVTIQNTGDAVLSNLAFTGATFIDCPTSLAVGASATCTATATASGDPFNVTLSVSGQDLLGGSASDSAAVSTDVLHPQIRVTVSALVSTSAGSAIHYAITVENTGDADLSNVSVTDSRTGFVWSGSLVAGGLQAFTVDSATGSNETGTVANTVSASGRDALGRTVSDSDNASTLVNLPDSDGDGVPDADEGGDTDGDGTPNYLDADSDGDGIPDAIEGTGDADGDGTPNFLDADSDGDTIPDSIEGAGDADGDGAPNFLDADSDGDGISDLIEWNVDTNGDGRADHDADGDGTPNFLDADSDNDGIPDAVEGAGDRDGDGAPNFVDTDSDGDGIPDNVECPSGAQGCTDTDGDNTPNFLDFDSDNDGINDAGEYSTGPSDKLAGCTANSPVCTDNDVDHDGIPNYRDTDSDGDGIPDSVEGAGDADKDGLPDYLDNINNTPPQYKLYLPFLSRNR